MKKTIILVTILFPTLLSVGQTERRYEKLFKEADKAFNVEFFKTNDNMSITEINQNFVIRYQWENDKSKLIGAGQYHKLVGEKLKNKHFKTVLEGKESYYTFKLRRGLKIDFRSK